MPPQARAHGRARARATEVRYNVVMSTPEAAKQPGLPTIDVNEYGGKKGDVRQSMNRRLFMQLLVFRLPTGTEPVNGGPKSAPDAVGAELVGLGQQLRDLAVAIVFDATLLVVARRQGAGERLKRFCVRCAACRHTLQQAQSACEVSRGACLR